MIRFDDFEAEFEKIFGPPPGDYFPIEVHNYSIRREAARKMWQHAICLLLEPQRKKR